MEELKMEVMLTIIAILTLAIVVLIFIIKSKNKTIKFQEVQINENNQTIRDKEIEISNLTEDMEIEKKYNKQLAKKLADISCMSIDDVLKQLQQ